MKLKIIDDFLPEDLFIPLQKALLGDSIDWYYQNSKTRPDELTESFQFVHQFFDSRDIERQPSDKAYIIKPLLRYLTPHVILRVKANLTTRTTLHDVSELHNDFLFGNKTAIYYVNTNNGYTRFEDNTIVPSIANRVVIFDCKHRHSGVTCTDEKVRVVLNVNYFPIKI
tara:strand:- start:82 stop:588 length:507 start_codon:yes stop_codon:yes gene_type:complete